ncbi:ABC transporter substrate-binding protein [Pseudonocardia spinosispora]|uniref:ABC transporter substrate-binding protein n=1 Tax=Pseudonocardia spinosispora TaxID=103441 RepID=UPI0003FB9ED7|nr:ABC transporter substrate-binding protein [Pseudonocardia spinosispora]
MPDALSRRGFLTVSALGVLAAGCAGPTAPSSGGGGIDTFTVGMQGAGAGEGIDPAANHLFIDEARLKAMYDGLFEIDDSMQPVPRLAESAEANADGTRWRIRLRDARWHDGTKLTSADVLYTLARVLGPSPGKPFIAATTLQQVDLGQSTAVDDRTVEIALKAPSFEFRTALAAYGTKIVKDGTKDFTKAVGTGPFRFSEFQAGKQLVATAYDDYWDGVPHIRKLTILSADADARFSALRGGQLDFAVDLSPAAAQQLRGAQGITVHTTHNSGIYYLAMKTDRPPFDNPDVRRAVMRMADRAELVKVAMQGQADVGNDVFGRGAQYYAADLPQHPYDPDQARSLLRSAGAEGLAFDLYTAPAATGMVEAANLFAEQARRSGVKVNVVLGSKDTYYTDVLSKNAMTMGQSGPLSIPNHFGSRLLTGAPQNTTKWAVPEFDALFNRAQATASEADRTAIYHQMHDMLYDRGGYVYWANSYWNNAAASTFGNLPTGVPNSTNWVRFNKVTASTDGS